MARSLLVFIGSPNVDSYINAMSRSVDEYKIEEIVLIKVAGLRSLENIEANKVKKNIENAVLELVDGIYRDKGVAIQAPGSKNFKNYEQVNDLFNRSLGIKTIESDSLRDEIAKLKNKYGQDTICDISGMPKKPAIEVWTACLAIGLEVTFFELNRKPSGADTLYHNLKPGEYTYVNSQDLSKTSVYYNIELFAAQKRRRKLMVIAIAMSLSVIVVWGQQIAVISGYTWVGGILAVIITILGLIGVPSFVEGGWILAEKH